MKGTQSLHNLGQRIWLDNITRELLDRGTLKRYIDDLSVSASQSSMFWRPPRPNCAEPGNTNRTENTVEARVQWLLASYCA